jgi:hypothetical protein
MENKMLAEVLVINVFETNEIHSKKLKSLNPVQMHQELQLIIEGVLYNFKNKTLFLKISDIS